MLDVDLKFKIDVAELFDQFNHFENENHKAFAAVGRDLSPHYATGIMMNNYRYFEDNESENILYVLKPCNSLRL